MKVHFKTQKERLDYLKGKFEEIVPVEVEVSKKSEKSEKKGEEKPAKAKKTAKSASKGKKNDKVQAE